MKSIIFDDNLEILDFNKRRGLKKKLNILKTEIQIISIMCLKKIIEEKF